LKRRLFQGVHSKCTT